MKRVFGNTIYDHLKPETADYLTKIEIKSRLKLKKLRDKNYKKNNGNGFIWGLTRKIATESQIESEMIILKGKQRKKKFNANPLERMLILGMIWKSWSSYTKKTKEDGGFDKMDIDSSIEELRD